jgi:hypothetical protein
MDSPDINITISIRSKNFCSGNAKTMRFEKMAPINTNIPINNPCTIAAMFKNPS